MLWGGGERIRRESCCPIGRKLEMKKGPATRGAFNVLLSIRFFAHFAW